MSDSVWLWWRERTMSACIGEPKDPQWKYMAWKEGIMKWLPVSRLTGWGRSSRSSQVRSRDPGLSPSHIQSFYGDKNCWWEEAVGSFLWAISCAQCWCSCGFWAMIADLYHGKKTENCSSVWSRWQQTLDFYTMHVSCNDFLWVLNLIFMGQIMILPSEARGTAREAEMPCAGGVPCSASQVLGWGSIPAPG